MSQKSVDIPGVGEVLLYKRRGNSNIRMSFARDGSLRVTMPYWVPYQAGVEFVKTRQNWVTEHQPVRQIILKENDRIGRSHRLHFIAKNNIQKTTVRTTDTQINVTYSSIDSFSNPGVQAVAQRGALKALKKQSDRLLPDRLEFLAKKHDFTYASLNTKRLSSRWGSCSSTKLITLNLFLMQLPWHLIDYVILHELVHTQHLDHSEKFWNRFEEVLPNAKKIRKELKLHQTVIAPQE